MNDSSSNSPSFDRLAGDPLARFRRFVELLARQAAREAATVAISTVATVIGTEAGFPVDDLAIGTRTSN